MPSQTQKTVIQEPSSNFLTFINTTSLNSSQLVKNIDSLPVSADVKVILSDLAKITIDIGKTILHIGKKILDFVLALFKQFPNLGFIVLIALVLSALIGPLIGPALSAIFQKLLLALGFVYGTKIEIESGDLAIRIREFVNNFSNI